MGGKPVANCKTAFIDSPTLAFDGKDRVVNFMSQIRGFPKADIAER